VLSLLAAFCVGAQAPKIQIQDPADEPLRASLERVIGQGVKLNESFFGRAYPRPLLATVYPSRASLDKAFHDRWGVDKTEPWMVAAGVADGIFLLSPRVWKSEAVEHNPDNEAHVRRIIAHELTHVYHGQLSPAHDFEGMDDLGWLAEGLATYVSGQLDEEHRGEDAEALAKGKGPTLLATAWSGRYRYAVSGSLVRFVDQKYGRKKLIELLGMTKPEEVLKALGTTEETLLRDWANAVKQSSSRHTSRLRRIPSSPGLPA
jgi:hypothetical protein